MIKLIIILFTFFSLTGIIIHFDYYEFDNN